MQILLGEDTKFLNKQKTHACREGTLCKCEHPNGLIVPTKPFLPLQEFSKFRKSLKYAGRFRNSSF